MGEFVIEYTETAIKHLKQHKKVGNKATLIKIKTIISELESHPYSGIGKPEQLKRDLVGYWSRRINQKDRLIYKVINQKVVVEIILAIGHYDDK